MSLRGKHALITRIHLAPALAWVIAACGAGEPAPPATKLLFVVQPLDGTAGVAITPAVQVAVMDDGDKVVASGTHSVTLTVSNLAGATLSGTTTVSSVSGIATFAGISVDKAASFFRLTATSSGLTAAQSDFFSVKAGAPARLVFVGQPANALGAVPIMGNSAGQIRVGVYDAFGNLASTATNPVTLSLDANPGLGTLFGQLTDNASDGIAEFTDARIDRPGTGYTLTATSPSLVPGTSAQFNVTLGFSTVSAGGTALTGLSSGHTCGLASGYAYCWGANTFGQLGDGTTADQVRPTLVGGGMAFSSVSAGGNHSCGLSAAGAGYCWGQNDHGQLGDGTTLHRSAPVAISGGLNLISITAGDRHTCAVTFSSHAAYCWGLNESGQLGDGTTTDRSVPTPVSGSIVFSLMLTLDSAHTCGIVGGPTAYCWGSNSRGQLGDGTTTGSSVPKPITGLALSEVTLGAGHTCGRRVANLSVYCWGAGDNSQIGDGSVATRLTPTLVAGGLSFSSLGGGWYHNCATTTTDEAYCWGYNANHQLGDGSVDSRSSPVAIGAGIAFTRIDGSRYHTCGIATGGVYCWGNNNAGQLGDGTKTERASPVRIIQ